MIFEPGENEDLSAVADLPEAQDKLLGMAQEIRLWQDAQTPTLSDNRMVQRFPALGSTKTYKKLREGDFDQLVIADWLPKYSGVLTQIGVETEAKVEDIYEDLSGVNEVYRTTLRLLQSRGLNRLLLIEGGSGFGKSESLRVVDRKLPGSVVLCEADETWKKPWAAITAMCVATGAVKAASELPNNLAGRIDVLVTKLQQRHLVCIDEGQHMSGDTLNTFKTLLNRTPSFFVIAALDTLWKKLQTNAWQEAKQLIHNRLFARIKLGGPTDADVKQYCTSRLKMVNDSPLMAKTYKALAITAAEQGGLAFLRNVAERCATLGVKEVDSPTLLEASRHVRSQVEGK